MASKFMKIWTVSGQKKAVVAVNLQQLKEKAIPKLNLSSPASNITIHLEDGTEIDEDEVYNMLPNGTILFLCQEGENPSQSTMPSSVISSSMNLSPMISSVMSSSMALSPISSTCLVEEDTTDLSIEPDIGVIKKAWPQDFNISFERCSPELLKHMQQGLSYLTWQTRHELLNILADDIAQYTVHPDIVQRKQVASKLVETFPNLKSKIDDGVSGWAERIYSKMKDFRLKQSTNEAKACRKRKSKFSEFVRVPHRGESNFLPESTFSSKEEEEMVNWMKEEAKKPKNEQNDIKIEKYLRATFPSRRKSLTDKILPFKIIKRNYPLLFTSLGLCREFKNLQDTDINEMVVNLLSCSEKIINEGKRRNTKTFESDNVTTPLRIKRQKASEMKEKILSDFHSLESIDEEHNLLCAFLLLPILLQEDTKDIYRITSADCKLKSICEGTSVPVLVFIENPFLTKEYYICGEGDVLIADLIDVKTAIAALFAIYYVCNVEYPSSCTCSFLFMQSYLLKLHHGRKLPAKLINFIEKL